MNKGVEILLERMKSNPEEFVGEGVYSKWSDLFSTYKDSLEPEDIQAFESARKALIQEHFTQAVMKELLDPKSQTNPYLVQPSATGLGGTTLGLSTNGAGTGYTWANTGAVTGTISANSLTLGNQTIDESTIAHMKLHAEYMKAQIRAEKAKPKRWWNKSLPELLGIK
jgi:hypothetical protein